MTAGGPPPAAEPGTPAARARDGAVSFLLRSDEPAIRYLTRRDLQVVEAARSGRDGGRGIKAWTAEVVDWGRTGPAR